MSGAAAQRRRWASLLIQKANSSLPAYGSEAWLALPEGSVEKVAAVVIAAECWAVEGDDLEDRLTGQLEVERHAFKRAEDEDYQARAVAHRERWRHLSSVPTRYAADQEVRPLEVIGADHVDRMREARR